MKDVVIFVMTSDGHINALRAYAHLFQKYWDSEQQVIVVGFTPPRFKLPSNFLFFSLGPQSIYPIHRWSDALIQTLRHFPLCDVFYLALEDYWLAQPVRKDIIHMAVDYMRQFRYVLKFDLCAERRYAAGSTPYGHLGDIPLVKSDPNSPYHFSLYSGLWNRDLLMRVLIPGESPWDIELTGTSRLAGYGDEIAVIGAVTDPWPMRHILAHRGGDSSHYLLDELSQEDIDELRSLGMIP